MSAAPGPSARQALEPCPFCGISPQPVVVDGTVVTHLRLPVMRHPIAVACVLAGVKIIGPVDHAAWNRRAAPDRAAIVEECAQVVELVCKANFMERGGLLVDKVVPRIRALKNSAGKEKDHG